jgi:hypothetical protein
MAAGQAAVAATATATPGGSRLAVATRPAVTTPQPTAIPRHTEAKRGGNRQKQAARYKAQEAAEQKYYQEECAARGLTALTKQERDEDAHRYDIDYATYLVLKAAGRPALLGLPSPAKICK